MPAFPSAATFSPMFRSSTHRPPSPGSCHLYGARNGKSAFPPGFFLVVAREWRLGRRTENGWCENTTSVKLCIGACIISAEWFYEVFCVEDLRDWIELWI
jgi:hypothetical protein